MAGTQAQGAWDQNMYNQNVGTYNNMMSGLYGLGGSAALAYGMKAPPKG